MLHPSKQINGENQKNENERNACERLSHYCSEEKNPFMQIFYLLLAGGMFFGYVFGLAPFLDGKYLSIMHNLAIPGLIILSVISFFIASCASVGYVTKENFPIFERAYGYDGVLDSEIHYCEICKTIRPPRTRHCSMCHKCVAKNDHHCPCVGAGNYRYFLLFLFMNSATCFYITFMCIEVLYKFVTVGGVYGKSIKLPDGRIIKIGMQIAIQALLRFRIWTIVTLLFSLCLFAVLFSFFAYHVYLASVNTTTIETFKWDKLKKNRSDASKIVDGKGFIRDVPPRYKEDLADDMKVPLKNRYNRGILANWWEVIYPLYKRPCYAHPQKSVQKSKSDEMSRCAVSGIWPLYFPNRSLFHWMRDPKGGEVERHERERMEKDKRRAELRNRRKTQQNKKKEGGKEENEEIDDSLTEEEWRALYAKLKEETLTKARLLQEEREKRRSKNGTPSASSSSGSQEVPKVKPKELVRPGTQKVKVR
eukprot:MONOS_6022.1-p1 / transcript=MONOS_6022.1 / gene=MONOS_6022 / organism=Monocercomonoides_exilis_PA203 / gene_product=DHHC-type zinc finger family protein isoform 2 / transcript_product=DHHC-type zinc finger family protein isoform 2 / location=Mono_scaffold00184:24163-26594(+) / protein_length=477 / sequence_SO=supercontig / SO=protein_coding / is_pseudo=false